MPQTWIDSTLVKTTFDVRKFQIWQAWKIKELEETLKFNHPTNIFLAQILHPFNSFERLVQM